MKANKIIISMGLAFLLLGCNNDSNKSNTTNTTETQKVSVPTQIDMKLPKALKNGSSSQKHFEKVDDSSTNKNRGYLELKDNVAQAEEELKMVKINLLLADKLMPQIQTECEDIPISQTCEIADGELSFVFDSQMRKEISNIIGEALPEDTPDETMTLGKSSFTIYPNTEDYQYVLTLDMSTMIRESQTDNTNYIQTIKWSKDENHIWSIYTQKDETTTASISSRYNKGTDGQTQMEIDELFNGSYNSSSSSSTTTIENKDTINLEDDTPSIEKTNDTFHFKITNKDDYFKIVANSNNIENDKQIYSDSSIGEVSDKGGYLNFKGVFFDNEYREINKFDANGNSVFSAYCDDSQECDLNDESTWIEQGDTTFDPAIEVQMIELSITGGNLKDGSYLLLAPDTDINKLSKEEISNATIGDIFIDKDMIFGTLYQKEYLSELNNLVIVRVSPDMKEVSFELVKAEDRPILSEK